MLTHIKTHNNEGPKNALQSGYLHNCMLFKTRFISVSAQNGIKKNKGTTATTNTMLTLQPYFENKAYEMEYRFLPVLLLILLAAITMVQV